MPNWCATNITVTGGEKELRQFANTVNGLLKKESVVQNGFGRFWLANLAAALGLVEPNIESINAFPGNLRGVIDPNPWAEACWIIGDPEKDNDPDQLSIDVIPMENGQAVIHFSTNSAWDMPNWLLDYLEKNIPNGEIAYRATDDCGNFFVRSANWGDSIYIAEGSVIDVYESFDEGEEKEFIEYILPYLDLDQTADEILAKENWPEIIENAVIEFNEKNEDADLYAIIYR